MLGLNLINMFVGMILQKRLEAKIFFEDACKKQIFCI